MQSANDNVQIALIGAGGMGQGDLRYALTIPGVAVVAVCDLYDGRLVHAKERWGAQVQTTRDYREVLARKDVDAVIIATPDHWHSTITIDALNAGKDIYCEKPMVQAIEQGHAVVAAQRKTGKIVQVGSQYASSLVYQKAKELIAAGAIGKVNLVEAWLDRNTAIGAWQYTIPPDASPQTVDWDRFLGSAPKREFDPTRFFRWRNYREYGTGVAGDLFVHLLTGLHFSMGVNGPSRVFATGGLRFWKDGRDVPDVMLAVMDYPDFNLALRVNFESSLANESFGVKFVGDEGVLTTSYNTLTIGRHPRDTEVDYSLGSFTKAMQERILAARPGPSMAVSSMRADREEHWAPPAGADAHRLHHVNFYQAVRSRKPFFEDAVFGLRTAGPALLTNTSYYEERACGWDPETMRAS